METRLTEILEQLDVPEQRKFVGSLGNLMWLNRNLFIRNAHHPLFKEANTLICNMLKEQGQSPILLVMHELDVNYE